MRGLRVSLAVVAVVMTGCGDGGSAVETRERSGASEPAAMTAAGAEPASMTAAAEAKPVLTSNRRESTDAKVQRLFERNGADFGARTPEEYVQKIAAFTERPPAGVARVERPNGDVLLYQASTNTFAVVSREGVAKTMFKPRDGEAYWAEQKAAAPTFGQRRSDEG